MKLLRTFISSFMLVNSIACAQNMDNKIILGNWMYAGSNSQQNTIECPDVLFVREGGEYTILNDCYGDALTPIIETGKWLIEDREDKIILQNRKFIISHYHFHSASKKLTGYIKSLSVNEMTICFDEKKSCIDETYKRMEKLTE